MVEACTLLVHFCYSSFVSVRRRLGLSHCRHLKTVRTHLSGLVHSEAVAVDETKDSATAGLTADVWQRMKEAGLVRVTSLAI